MATTEKQKLIDEGARPLSERALEMEADIDSFLAKWFALTTPFANDATPYIDGRDDEGLTQVPESTINNVTTCLSNAKDAITAGRAELLKLTVRTLFSAG